MKIFVHPNLMKTKICIFVYLQFDHQINQKTKLQYLPLVCSKKSKNIYLRNQQKGPNRKTDKSQNCQITKRTNCKTDKSQNGQTAKRTNRKTD